MNELANGLGNASKKIALGAPMSVINGVVEHFASKGLKVRVVDEDDFLKEDCDICIYQTDREEDSVNFSPFKADGYGPIFKIGVNNLSPEMVLHKIIEVLEVYQF